MKIEPKICSSCGDFFISMTEIICEECRENNANEDEEDIPFVLRQDDDESDDEYIWRTCGIG